MKVHRTARPKTARTTRTTLFLTMRLVKMGLLPPPYGRRRRSRRLPTVLREPDQYMWAG
jgi:hypothetical protein